MQGDLFVSYYSDMLVKIISACMCLVISAHVVAGAVLVFTNPPRYIAQGILIALPVLL